MKPSWSRIRAIAEGALERPPSEREEFVRSRCGDDSALRDEVESLLAAEFDSRTLSQLRPAGEVFESISAASFEPRPGARIGQFTLSRAIASGGMGTVFEATQSHPQRTVALKTMRMGLVDRDSLRRFRYEADALARLQHQNIAQVFEAGTEPVPYIAMELVAGARTLRGYADDHRLSTRARLELFVTVCEAVHFGHQRGVIHRDLKPSNILVDDRGVVKVIDYGVARVTANDSSRSLRTVAGDVIGTLQYMSPEQTRGDPDAIDVRTDVYSLGAVLHELLCAKPLFDLRGKSLLDSVRILTTTEPVLPSAIDPTIPKEVDWIVARAVAPERDRRYRSASDLGADIERHLENEALEAGPPSGLYRALKFARRHRIVLSALAMTILALVAGLIVSLRAKADAERSSRTAAIEAQRANETLAFISSIFAAVKADGGSRDAKVKDVLDAASLRIDRDLAGQPLVEATVRAMIGHCYLTLDDLDAAAPHIERSLELRLAHLGDSNAETLRQRVALGHVRRQQGRHADAEREYRLAAEGLERVAGSGNEDTLVAIASLAAVLADLGRTTDAEAAYRKSLALAQRYFSGGQIHAMAESQCALFLFKLGKDEEAQQMLDHAASLTGRSAEEVGFYGLQLRLYAASQRLNKDPIGAVSQLESICADASSLLGDEHEISISALAVLGRARAASGDNDGGIRDLERAVSTSSAARGDDTYTTIASRTELGKLLAVAGRAGDAETQFRTAIACANRLYGVDAPDTLEVRVDLATLYVREHRIEDAEAEVRATYEVSRGKYGVEAPITRRAARELAKILDAAGRNLDAEALRAEFPDR